jgi:hypothetical protein
MNENLPRSQSNSGKAVINASPRFLYLRMMLRPERSQRGEGRREGRIEERAGERGE